MLVKRLLSVVLTSLKLWKTLRGAQNRELTKTTMSKKFSNVVRAQFIIRTVFRIGILVKTRTASSSPADSEFLRQSTGNKNLENEEISRF